MPSNSRQFVTKEVIAKRYGVCIRTVNSWMRRRVLPFIKTSGRTVRFDAEQCDIAIEAYEYKSIFDGTIKQELARRQAMNGGEPLQLQKDLAQKRDE